MTVTTFLVLFDVQRRSGDGDWTREESEVEAETAEEAEQKFNAEMWADNDFNYFDVVSVTEL